MVRDLSVAVARNIMLARCMLCALAFVVFTTELYVSRIPKQSPATWTWEGPGNNRVTEGPHPMP